jgi:hypothetical protein
MVVAVDTALVAVSGPTDSSSSYMQLTPSPPLPVRQKSPMLIDEGSKTTPGALTNNRIVRPSGVSRTRNVAPSVGSSKVLDLVPATVVRRQDMV